MADPKTNRALGQQTSNRGDVDADEDPLVELARIVSEDGGFSGPRTEKPRVARNEPPVRDALADGLEAELLQELETSFAAREVPPAKPRSPVAQPRVTSTAAPAPRPAPVQQRAAPPPVRQPAAHDDADPDELLRSIEEQLSQFERRQSGRFAAAPSAFSPEPIEPEGANGSDALADQPSELPFGAPEGAAEGRDEWHGRRASRIRPFAEIPEALDAAAEAPVAEPIAEEPPRSQAPRPEYRFRGPASADWDRPTMAREEEPIAPPAEKRKRHEEPASFEDEEPESLPFSPAELTAAAQAPIREEPNGNGARRGRADAANSSDTRRRDRLNATFPEFDEEPAPERAAPDLTGIEAELSRELEPRFATGASDKWQDGDEPASEPRVAAAIAPGASRRAAAQRAAAQQRGRSRLGLFAAAVILVVVIGGAAAFYLRGPGGAPSGPPPVITADEGAVRVEPAQGQQASEGETVGDAVYNRVAGNTAPADEQVVDNSEEPKEVARIVLPQSQTNSADTVVRPVGGDGDASTAPDASAPAPATDAAANESAPAAASNESEIGPRRVPTFVVKADGSIVATSDAGAPAPDPTAMQDQQLTGETEPIKPVRVPTVAIAQASAPAANSTNAAPPAEPPASNAQSDQAMETRPTIDEPPAEVAAAEPAASPPAPAAEAPAEANTVDQIAVASAEPPPPAPATTAGGGYSVQLSSEGSMADAQAAFARAQQKFPAVLGKLDPQIQEADLGAKGIFYRVRVGPWADRKQAVDLCEALKAAGGNCFVAK